MGTSMSTSIIAAQIGFPEMAIVAFMAAFMIYVAYRLWVPR